ncbi:hypothetical protein KQ940_13280 [Marinobacterium sp. D7]|uniref:hypothetical protein n=1 Tax=Marinobacterium ramblicola TaxID=2849041 RepID=UPI001C2DA8E6|nr:hypothetical protein [Marinobacterium ramblicola]MBV1789024.1 hypothetical protein [Marinobacterium ramblicola]
MTRDIHISKFSWLQNDNLLFLNQHFLNHVKNQARKLQKQTVGKLSRLAALDTVSRSYNFESWKNLQAKFRYESAGSVRGTLFPSADDHPFDCHTDRQLHGAVYRYFNIKPINQVVQLVFDESDFVHAWLDHPLIENGERGAFDLFLSIGLVNDYPLEKWLVDNDPFFQEPDYEYKAFRFIHPHKLSHDDACAIIEERLEEHGFIGFGRTCCPQYIWIDGRLPEDTTPPDIEEGDDSCPLLVLPEEAWPRVYE